MNLPPGDRDQNERNRQLEAADRFNVKRDRQNDIIGTIRLQSPDGTWWTIKVSDAGVISAA